MTDMHISENTNITQTWPVVYSEVLETGNIESNVAICTLWTHRKTMIKHLDPHSYAVVGNLYGFSGVSAIIRNIYANPLIRYIILVGTDLTGSGEAFVEFMNCGIDDTYKTPSGKVTIEKEIPLQAIQRFRENINLVDIRGEKLESVQSIIDNLDKLGPFDIPTEFPISEALLDNSNSSELSGFRVSGKSVADTWLEVIYTVRRFGKNKRTKYGNTNELQELINLTAVVYDEDCSNVYVPGYLPLDKERIERYYPQVTSAINIDGTSYTYGQRLRDHNGIDQIVAIIDNIKKNPHSKRLYATTWNVAIDTFTKADVPCLTQVNVSFQNEQLMLTGHFRSQDMYSAWHLNAFALRKLQSIICEAVSIPIGPLTIVTHSAHIYAWNWEATEEVIHEYLKRKKPAAELDLRGYVTISVKPETIEAVLHNYNNQAIDIIIGKDARSIGIDIAKRLWISTPGHALYIGRELMKAEFALVHKLPYIQDSDITIRSI